MKKIYLFIIVVSVLIGGILAADYFSNRNPQNTVSINGKQFKVELARTDTEREKGLMNRDHLDADNGMLFIFKKSEIQTFWMKNTLIPLDIIWIDKDKIVDVTTLDPETPDFTPQYTPKEKAKYVLELNAGTANENNFKIGDVVKIK